MPGRSKIIIRTYGKRVLRSIYWPRPLLYAPVAWKLYRQEVFTYRYDVLVDGFPRSANTYIVHLIRALWPEIAVRSHLHCPTFAIACVRQKIPAIVTIREPVAAVSSWVVHRGCEVREALDFYIQYYQTLVPYLDTIAVIPFEQAVGHPAHVAPLVAHSLGVSPPHQGRLSDQLQAAVMVSIEKEQHAMTIAQASYPHPARKTLIAPIRERVQSARYRLLLLRAEALFERFSARNRALTASNPIGFSSEELSIRREA